MSAEGGGSIRLETLLIVACIVAVFAAAVIYAAKSGARRVELMRDFAASRGWSFSATDTEALAAKVDALSPEFKFRLHNVMRVEGGSPALHLFDYQYHYREQPRTDYHGVGCLIESAAFRAVAAGQDVVEITDGTAKSVLPPALQATLQRHREAPLYNPVTVRIGAAGAVVLNRSLDPEPDRWADLVELCRKLEASLR